MYFIIITKMEERHYILKPIVLSSSKCRCNTIGIRKFIGLQNSFFSSQGRQTAIIIVLVS